MNNCFTIGFKFKSKDFTATVNAYATTAFAFFRVTLNDEELKREFGPYLTFARNTLTHNAIESIKTLPGELKKNIIDELSLMNLQP